MLQDLGAARQRAATASQAVKAARQELQRAEAGLPKMRMQAQAHSDAAADMQQRLTGLEAACQVLPIPCDITADCVSALFNLAGRAQNGTDPTRMVLQCLLDMAQFALQLCTVRVLQTQAEAGACPASIVILLC